MFSEVILQRFLIFEKTTIFQGKEFRQILFFIEVVMLYLFIEVVWLCRGGFVVYREWCWVVYVLPECWFISVPANFRFSICPLFSKGHAEISREFRHDLCYKLGHIECPGFAAPGRSQRSCKTIGLFYVIIHFIRSRINWLDLIIGNMASNDETGFWWLQRRLPGGRRIF